MQDLIGKICFTKITRPSDCATTFLRVRVLSILNASVDVRYEGNGNHPKEGTEQLLPLIMLIVRNQSPWEYRIEEEDGQFPLELGVWLDSSNGFNSRARNQ